MKSSKPFLMVGISFALVAAGYGIISNARAIGASMMPLALTMCSSSSACTAGVNTGTGPGVTGVSTDGRGMNASTKHNSTASSNAQYGIVGSDQSTSGPYNAGVFGLSSRGTGVKATSSTGTALTAFSPNGTAASVSSQNFYGLYALSNGSYGVVALGGNGTAGLYASSSGYGVYANGDQNGVYGYSNAGMGMRGESTNGTGVYTTTESGFALQAIASGGHAVYVANSNGNGIDSTGSYGGVVARAPSGAFPLIVTDSAGNNLFYVTGTGDVYYHGGLHSFATRAGAAAPQSYSPQSTMPAIEETGTARLTFGRAVVYLSPALARSIDTRRGYQVFLTPDGDTRGLYVATKSASGFMVREIQGGRGNFEFDYHVYATSAPGPSPNASSGAQPHVPVLHPAVRASRRLPIPRAPKP